jgi:NAD(P)H dehydrogenase (quinone)
MIKVAIIYHSTYGHTKLQAEAVHGGASGVDEVDAQIMTAGNNFRNSYVYGKYIC